MSTLVQALKNLEAKSITETSRKTVLNHLADKSRTPSPDPPASTSSDVSDPRQPSPIGPLPADSPLAYLSAGMPTVVLQQKPSASAGSSNSAATVGATAGLPSSAAPVSAYSAVIDPPGATSSTSSAVAIEEPRRTNTTTQGATAGLPSSAGSPGATAGSTSSAFPIEDPRRTNTTTLSPRLTARPPRPPTPLERTVRRILSEPERAESFRQLADRLKADLDQITGRSIVFAGIGPASETYEVVLHAAAILAEAGEPILIIDGDVVRRSLTKGLELTQGTGLVELARGEIPDSDPIQELTLTNLSILPAGMAKMPAPASTTERLTSLIQSLEGSYRLVIIDAGRASDRTAASLARLCDATYFVARLGETEAFHAQSALKTFRAAGARLLGCVATS
ncbi:MAG: hypothetical protein L0211_12710 [Planctomycetaceae bacterium]|nr:hypothetical protein [Planctomycetaceae bacterium]